MWMPVRKRRDHDRGRMLSVHRDRAITERLAGVRRFERRDVSPLLSLRLKFPNRAVSHCVRTGFAAVSQIKNPVR